MNWDRTIVKAGMTILVLLCRPVDGGKAQVETKVEEDEFQTLLSSDPVNPASVVEFSNSLSLQDDVGSSSWI